MSRLDPHPCNGTAVLAPMAGVTDWPFRQICASLGAARVTGEMTSSNPALRDTIKSRARTARWSQSLESKAIAPETPRIIQIAGTEPAEMAEAAEYQVSQGADVIDINMGCPAKKVCRKLAGSALLRDEALVQAILEAVVQRVEVPVTLKIRTGWDPETRNATTIARIAEQAGIQSLAVHGRTRACRFNGQAEYDSIAEVVQAVSIPVFANGDIDSAEKAARVLRKTGAAGVMIGRAALGRPWIFSQINDLFDEPNVYCGLFNGKSLNFNDANTIRRLIIKHLQLIEHFYCSLENDQPAQKKSSKLGNNKGFSTVPMGVKVARKHICWYFDQLKHIMASDYGEETNNREDAPAEMSKNASILQWVDASRSMFNRQESHIAQREFIDSFFWGLTTGDYAA